MSEVADERQHIVADLLKETGASRVTLREEVSNAFFPVARETLAPGVASIKDVEAPNMRQQPVIRELVKGHQVVQDDCLTASDEADFQEMLNLYGGMRAQIVTPVLRDGALKAIFSVHQLATPRRWTDADIESCNRASKRMTEILAAEEETTDDPLFKPA